MRIVRTIHAIKTMPSNDVAAKTPMPCASSAAARGASISASRGDSRTTTPAIRAAVPAPVTSESALLVEPGNVRELARAIIKLVESPDLRARLGARAREVAVQKHTWTRNAERVLQAFKDLNDEHAG